MNKRFTITARNGKILNGTDTMQDALNSVEFYERNDPSYSPCYIRDNKTYEIFIPSAKPECCLYVHVNAENI